MPKSETSLSGAGEMVARMVCAAFLILIIVTVLGGCQKPTRSQPAPPQLPPVESSRYFIHDHACQEDAQSSMGADSTSIYLTGFARDLNLNASQQSLSTELIGNTFYGQTYQRSCHFYIEQGQRCLDANFNHIPWTRVRESGGMLRICDAEQGYPRESFEHVALVSALHLQEAQRFFMASTGLVVPAMSLLVLPFFRTLYTDMNETKRQTIMYHNIIYFPPAKSLAVLPDRDDFRGRSLWESAFVMAHEFAHHAQFAAQPKTHNTLALMGYQRTAESARRQLSNSIEAFLEGWADLFAFYAEREDSSGIAAYPCFGFNRDVANPMFADRSVKVITAATIDSFYKGESTRSPCARPDYSDPHIIGAIFAHHLHRVVSFLLRSGMLDEPSAAIKYRYLHRWFAAVLDRIQHESSSKDLLRVIIAAVFQEIASDLQRQQLEVEQRAWLTEQVCMLFEIGFPSISGCTEEQ